VVRIEGGRARWSVYHSPPSAGGTRNPARRGPPRSPHKKPQGNGQRTPPPPTQKPTETPQRTPHTTSRTTLRPPHAHSHPVPNISQGKTNVPNNELGWHWRGLDTIDEISCWSRGLTGSRCRFRNVPESLGSREYVVIQLHKRQGTRFRAILRLTGSGKRHVTDGRCYAFPWTQLFNRFLFLRGFASSSVSIDKQAQE